MLYATDLCWAERWTGGAPRVAWGIRRRGLARACGGGAPHRERRGVAIERGGGSHDCLCARQSPFAWERTALACRLPLHDALRGTASGGRRRSQRGCGEHPGSTVRASTALGFGTPSMRFRAAPRADDRSTASRVADSPRTGRSSAEPRCAGESASARSGLTCGATGGCPRPSPSKVAADAIRLRGFAVSPSNQSGQAGAARDREWVRGVAGMEAGRGPWSVHPADAVLWRESRQPWAGSRRRCSDRMSEQDLSRRGLYRGSDSR
jgi:hypothetical protein